MLQEYVSFMLDDGMIYLLVCQKTKKIAKTQETIKIHFGMK